MIWLFELFDYLGGFPLPAVKNVARGFIPRYWPTTLVLDLYRGRDWRYGKR